MIAPRKMSAEFYELSQEQKDGLIAYAQLTDFYTFLKAVREHQTPKGFPEVSALFSQFVYSPTQESHLMRLWIEAQALYQL